MQRLIEGYRRFRETGWIEHRARFEALADKGQRPRALVVACSDSRVDPQMIFGAAPGELFVIRNVASLVPPYAPDADHHGTSAALEFAVRFLKVRHLVIMGHGQCGGVAALLRGPESEAKDDFIGQWMQIASEARARVIAKADPHSEEAHRMGELETVKVSLANLMTFPWVRERVEAGSLLLHGCYFNIASGELERLGADGTFTPIV
jgi:carbonic anhydrase